MILSPSPCPCVGGEGGGGGLLPSWLESLKREGVGKSTLLLTTLLARQVFTQVAVSLPDPSTLTQGTRIKI